MEGSELREFLFINSLTFLASIHFLLATKGTAQYESTLLFVVMWFGSLIFLLFLKMSSSNEKELVEYDGNLEREHLLWNLTGLGGLFIVGSLLVRFIGLDTMSSFYVPRLSLQSGVGTLVEDLLYNVVLVAPSEESIKLVGSLVLYRTIGKSPFGEAISIVAPIGFWSLLHAYQNPVYIGHPVLVLSAFFGGLILFALIKVTGSIVNAQIVHSAYNSIILLIQFV